MKKQHTNYYINSRPEITKLGESCNLSRPGTSWINFHLSCKVQFNNYLSYNRTARLVLQEKLPTYENNVKMEYYEKQIMPWAQTFDAIYKKIQDWPLHSIGQAIVYVLNRLEEIAKSVSLGNNVLTVKAIFVDEHIVVYEKANFVTPKMMLEFRRDLQERLPPFKTEHPDAKNTTVQEDSESYESCPICMDDFVGEVGIGIGADLLCCGHGFHHDCIAVWLEKNSRCPICRCEMSIDEIRLLHYAQKVTLSSTTTRYMDN